MDLVTGAKKVIVAMQHTAKEQSKIVQELSLPPTAARSVSLIVTELAVIEPTEEGLVLKEHAPGVTVDMIIAKTQAHLIIKTQIAEMNLS